MTLRYVLLVCVSMGVFTAFALAQETKIAPQSLNPYSKKAQDALRNEVENSYFTERNNIAKATEVSGDPFDDFSGATTRAPHPKDAVRPVDPKVEASQIKIRQDLKDAKTVATASDSSASVYPIENRDSMKEAVIEVQNEQGVHIKPDFDAANWQKAQAQAQVILLAP